MGFRTAHPVDVGAVRAQWEAAQARSADLRTAVRRRDAVAKEVVAAMRDTYWSSSNERWDRIRLAAEGVMSLKMANASKIPDLRITLRSIVSAKAILAEHWQDTDPRVEHLYVDMGIPTPSADFPADAVDIHRLSRDLEDMFSSFDGQAKLIAEHRRELAKLLKDAELVVVGREMASRVTQRGWIALLSQFLEDEGCFAAFAREQRPDDAMPLFRDHVAERAAHNSRLLIFWVVLLAILMTISMIVHHRSQSAVRELNSLDTEL